MNMTAMDSSLLYKANADAFSLWLDSGRASSQEAGMSGENARNVRDLLKEEDKVRVVERLVAHLPVLVVSKIYQTPKQLAWRSLFLPSRAHREYRHLKYGFQRGLPVIEPLAWSETRVWGCPVYSQLTMVRAEGLPLPEAVEDPRMTGGMWQQLAAQLGTLLARMHAAGMVWMTAYARNVLVDFNSGNESGPRLTAIDFPYAWCTGKSMVAGSCAGTDLWWMCWTCQQQCRFDDTLLQALLQAYAREAGLVGATLAGKISRRSRFTCALNRIFTRTLQIFSHQA